MTGIIRVHAAGGPDVLSWESVEVGAPGPGELRVRHTAIGINYIDVYHRSGFYAQPLPFIPGVEGAGIVEAVGPGVTSFRSGATSRMRCFRAVTPKCGSCRPIASSSCRLSVHGVGRHSPLYPHSCQLGKG